MLCALASAWGKMYNLSQGVRSTTYLAPDKRNLVTLILFPQSHERWTVSPLHTECGALTAGS